MNCACRAAPWRNFIQGLAQVHNFPAVVAKSRLSAAVAFAAPRVTTRSFGMSRLLLQGEGSARAAVDGNREEDTEVQLPAVAESPLEEGSFLAEQLRERRDSFDYGGRERKDDIGSTGRERKDPSGSTGRERKDSSGYYGGKAEQQNIAYTSRFPASSPRPTYRSRAPKVKEGNDNREPKRENEPRRKEHWQIQKQALKEKFPEGWAPRKRLSPDALAGIRALNAQFPDVYTTEALAGKFKVSPEAIRRILKSKWRASAVEEEERQDRWFNRGKQVWERQAALGVKPPKKWRKEGIVRDKEWHERRQRAVKWEREWEEREKNEERERRANRRSGNGGSGTGGWE